MADTITSSRELVVELYAERDGIKYSRNLRIPNPLAKQNISRNSVATALEPAIAYVDSTDTSVANVVPYFYDDTDSTVGLTNIGNIEYIETTRTTYE